MFFSQGVFNSGPVTYTFVAASSGSGSGVSYPTGTAIGDVVVHGSAGSLSSGTPSITLPSGWASFADNIEGTNHRMAIHAKIINGSDNLAGTKSNMSGNTRIGYMFTFRPSRSMRGLRGYSEGSFGTTLSINTTVPNGSVFPSDAVPGVILIAFAYAGGAGIADGDTGGSLITNGAVYRPSILLHGAREVQNQFLTVRTFTLADNGSENMVSSIVLSEIV